MDAKGLASLRTEFGALLKKHDGTDFRFIVEMLYHCEPLEAKDFSPDVWQAGNRAVSILDDAGAKYDRVYEWGLRGAGNSKSVHKKMFLTHGSL